MLAYDIHDGVLQDLVSAKWAIESNLVKVQSGQSLDTELLESAQDLIGNAITELRQTVLQHRPFTLGEQNLGEAIQDYLNRLPQAKATQIELEFAVDCRQLRGDLQLNLYRMVQQAVHNSLSHARSNKICVSLSQTPKEIRLSVSDNGIGFEQAVAGRVGLGHESIRERAAMFDGTCRIESQDGHGTTVDVTIPLFPGAADAQ